MTVGHCTLAAGDVQTGVTVVRPHAADPFLDKVPGAAVVINGFGKSVGILQVNELGVLETPIALTNTFSVGTVATAQIRAAIAAHPGIARTTTSVNPLVFECSDAFLSDMQALVHRRSALRATRSPRHRLISLRGSVGAGRGMTLLRAQGRHRHRVSRWPRIGSEDTTLGALVLANFGRTESLTLAGRADRACGRAAPREPSPRSATTVRSSSCSRPTRRSTIASCAAWRCARPQASGAPGRITGTAAATSRSRFRPRTRFRTRQPRARCRTSVLAEPLLEALFDAAAEATEAAIVDALFTATTVTGFKGHTRYALTDVAPDWAEIPLERRRAARNARASRAKPRPEGRVCERGRRPTTTRNGKR